MQVPVEPQADAVPEQTEHVPPLRPQADAEVPGTHVPAWQQPVQLLGPHGAEEQLPLLQVGVPPPHTAQV